MRIWFTKRGLQIEKEKQQFESVTEGINHYYNLVVCIEEGLNLEEFFDCLEPYFRTIDKDFVSYSKGVSIRDFYKEVKKKGTDNPEVKDIECLEFSKNIVINTSYDNEPSSLDEEELEDGGEEIITWIEDNLKFHGLIEEGGSNEYIPYYIEFIPLNDLKHLEVFINNDCMISTITSKNFEENFEFKDIGMSTFYPTLFEMIKTFIQDISFYGSPKDRNVAYEDFQEKIKNLPSFEDIINKVQEEKEDDRSKDEIALEKLQKELYEEQEKENYHKCSLILKDIKIIQERIKNKKDE